jgi:hypothetical protein
MNRWFPRAHESTEFSYQIHRASFQFAGDTATIGQLPWALLTHVNVPAMGELIGGVIYGPEAFLKGIEAGLTSLAINPMNTAAANAAFEGAYAAAMAQRRTLGGNIINTTIENLNSPRGYSAMPWWGIGLRVAIDSFSALTAFAYD